MSNIRRSTTGCWTCRARRKKCDESGPPCSICSALSLTCYGYDNRPSWMDGGAQEKAQIEAFKAVVKRSKMRSHRRGSAVAPFEMDESRARRNDSVVEEDHVKSVNGESSLDATLDWLDSTHGSIQSIDTFLNDASFSYHGPDSLEDDWMTFRWTEDEGNKRPEDNNALANNVQQPPISISATTSPHHTPFPQSFGLVAPPWRPLDDIDLVNAVPKQSDSTLCTGIEVPMKLSACERRSWQHYTDRVLPAMFHFTPLEVAQRQFSEALRLCQSPATCLSQVVAQTEQLQAFELERFGLRKSDSIGCRGHSSATFSPQPSRSCSWHCSLHVLMIQILLGGQDWQNVLSSLSDMPSAAPNTLSDSPLTSVTLAYLDVLGSTATGQMPSTCIQYLASAAKTGLEAPRGVGVDTWLLSCLVKIIQLRKWKADRLNAGSLSVSDLLQASSAIKADMEQGYASTQLPGQSSNASPNAAFTRVFAAATQVFLHCAIFEPRPEIVEIQQEVHKTMDAMQSLPEVLLLKRLSWPVCIAASMAQGVVQQEFFKSLQERLEAAWGPEENICRGLRAATECWRLRERAPPGKPFDWADGMKSLGQLWLLF